MVLEIHCKVSWMDVTSSLELLILENIREYQKYHFYFGRNCAAWVANVALWRTRQLKTRRSKNIYPSVLRWRRLAGETCLFNDANRVKSSQVEVSGAETSLPCKENESCNAGHRTEVLDASCVIVLHARGSSFKPPPCNNKRLHVGSCNHSLSCDFFYLPVCPVVNIFIRRQISRAVY